jgi:hypothetical protein
MVRGSSRVVKKDLLLRIVIVWLHLRWRRQKDPQRISEDIRLVFPALKPEYEPNLHFIASGRFRLASLG